MHRSPPPPPRLRPSRAEFLFKHAAPLSVQFSRVVGLPFGGPRMHGLCWPRAALMASGRCGRCVVCWPRVELMACGRCGRERRCCPCCALMAPGLWGSARCGSRGGRGLCGALPRRLLARLFAVRSCMRTLIVLVGVTLLVRRGGLHWSGRECGVGASMRSSHGRRSRRHQVIVLGRRLWWPVVLSGMSMFVRCGGIPEVGMSSRRCSQRRLPLRSPVMWRAGPRAGECATAAGVLAIPRACQAGTGKLVASRPPSSCVAMAAVHARWLAWPSLLPPASALASLVVNVCEFCLSASGLRRVSGLVGAARLHWAAVCRGRARL